MWLLNSPFLFPLFLKMASKPVEAPKAALGTTGARAFFDQFQQHLTKNYANESQDVMNEMVEMSKKVFAGLQHASKYVTNNLLQEALTLGPTAQVGNSVANDPQADLLLVDRVVRNANRIAASVLRDGLQDDQSKVKSLRQVSRNSFVSSDELVFVHLWMSRREGRRFQSTLRALAQARHNAALPSSLAVVHSVALIYQTRFVTVSWLPPLIEDSPVSYDSEGLSSAVEELWRVSAGGNVCGQRLVLHPGADGRYYCLGGPSVLVHLGDRGMETSNVCRPEWFLADRHGVEDDYRAVEVHVENALHRAAVSLGEFVMSDEKMKDAPFDVASVVSRDSGLNRQFLHRLRAMMLQTLQATGNDRAGNATMDHIDTEMVGRSLKSIIEAQLMMSAIEAGGAPAATSATARLQIVNDVVTTFFKSPEFLQNVLMGVMRLKFRAGENFSVHPAHLKLGSIARMLSDKLAMNFDPKQRRFTGFFEQPLVVGNTARKAGDVVKAAVTRRIHELMFQSANAKSSLMILAKPPFLSLAPKIAPALAAMTSALACAPETYPAAAATAEKELSQISKDGSLCGHAKNPLQLRSGLALFFSTRAQLLCADLTSESALMEQCLINEVATLSAVVTMSSSLNGFEVEFIVSRALEALRCSADAVAATGDHWLRVLGTLLQQCSAGKAPLSKELEKDLEIKSTFRRALLAFAADCPLVGSQLCRVHCADILALATSFPRNRQLPSLLLVSIFASYVLADELATNGEPPDLDDANALQHLWDQLLFPRIPMWLMVADGCESDAAYEDSLGKSISDDDAVTLLQFVQMVSKVGYVQRLLAADRGVQPDPRKILLGDFASFFRSQIGASLMESKLRKVHDDVDRLVEPFT